MRPSPDATTSDTLRGDLRVVFLVTAPFVLCLLGVVVTPWLLLATPLLGIAVMWKVARPWIPRARGLLAAGHPRAVAYLVVLIVLGCWALGVLLMATAPVLAGAPMLFAVLFSVVGYFPCLTAAVAAQHLLRWLDRR